MPAPVRVPMHPTEGFGGTPPVRQEAGDPLLPFWQPPLTGLTGVGGVEATPVRVPDGGRKVRKSLHASPDKEGEFIEEFHAEDLFSPSRVDPVVLTAFREHGKALDPSIKQVLKSAIRHYAHSATSTRRGSRKHMFGVSRFTSAFASRVSVKGTVVS